MKHSAILILLVFLTLFKASGQDRFAKLKTLMLTSDSIFLVSHESTTGIILVNERTGKKVPLPKLIVNGRLNKSIIHETRIIKDSSIESLINILTRPFQDSIIEIGKCFMPHHAVIIFKKGKISFIDMCFTCKGIETSKDIKLTISDFDDRKWNELMHFLNNET
jgi:hypothetical protein